MQTSPKTQPDLVKADLQSLSTAIRSPKTPSKPHQVSLAAATFQSTLLSSDISHLHPSSLPSDQTNEAIEHIWRNLAKILSTLPPHLNHPSTSLLQSSLDSLNASNILLEHAYISPLPRIPAANTAAPELIFSTTRLSLSLSLPDLPANLQSGLSAAIKHATRHLHQMRHAPSPDLLTSRLYPQIHPYLLAALKSEHDISPSSNLLPLHYLTPSSHLLSTLAQSIHPTPSFPRAAPLLLSLLLPQLEDISPSKRSLSIRTISSLLPSLLRENLLKPHLHPLISSLTSATVWHDPPSTTQAIPLLVRLLHLHHLPAPLSVPPPAIWSKAVQRIRDTISHHATCAPPDDPDSHLRAATLLAPLIPPLSRHLLVASAADWVPMLSRLLVRAAAMLKRDALSDAEFQRLVETVVDSVRWTWPLAHRYYMRVFTECLAAFLENSSRVVRSGVVDVLGSLAEWDARRVLKAVRCARREADGYGSLKGVEGVLEQVEGGVGVGQGGVGVGAGILVGRFFAEVGWMDGHL